MKPVLLNLHPRGRQEGAGYNTNSCFSLPAEYSRRCAGNPVPGTFFFVSKKIIRHEIQLIDELVVVSFEPPDARPACDRIRRHFVNAEW